MSAAVTNDGGFLTLDLFASTSAAAN